MRRRHASFRMLNLVNGQKTFQTRTLVFAARHFAAAAGWGSVVRFKGKAQKELNNVKLTLPMRSLSRVSGATRLSLGLVHSLIQSHSSVPSNDSLSL